MAEAKHSNRPLQTRYFDGCPSCMARHNRPLRLERPDPRTVVAHYVCRRCEQDWHTSYWEASA
jgi:hypothetical protein